MLFCATSSGNAGLSMHGSVDAWGATGVANTKGKHHVFDEVDECSLGSSSGGLGKWMRWLNVHADGAGAVGNGVRNGNGCAATERGLVPGGHHWNDGDGRQQ